MKTIMDKIKNQFYYSVESIKNRFPCKIVSVKSATDFTQETKLTFQAATKINVREQYLREINDDPMLIEKFHPTDCIKLGFLAAGDILLKEGMTIEEARKTFKQVVNQMFYYEKDSQHDPQQ